MELKYAFSEYVLYVCLVLLCWCPGACEIGWAMDLCRW